MLKRTGLILLVLCLLLDAAGAQEVDYGGHLKYQPSVIFYDSDDVNALLGPDTVLEHELDLRGLAEGRWNDFDGKIHAELLGLGGNGLEAQKKIRELNPFVQDRALLLNDDRRVLDLTAEIMDEDDAAAVLRLDRLAAGWTGEWAVLRVGRQSITWGNGLVFAVNDLFNPFSPVEIDKDYKTGDDMVFAQGLFPWGGDVQGLVVGRRDPITDSVSNDQSSFASKWHERISGLEVDVDLLAARHFDENVFGLGMSRELFQGIIRTDVTVTEIKEGSKIVSAVVNLDRSWVLLDKNVYGYVEYYRNGFGSGDGNYDDLSPELIARVIRGEVFALGRDYLALGGRVELTALLNWHSNIIFNLHDESGFIQQRFAYDLYQDVMLTLGVNVLYGPRGSEFGGIPLSTGEGYLAGGDSLYVRAAYYF